MRTLTRIFFFLMLLGLVSQAPSVCFGQDGALSMFAPQSSQVTSQVTDLFCGKYQYYVVKDSSGKITRQGCWRNDLWFPWYAAGAGWQSWISFSNISASSNWTTEFDIQVYSSGGVNSQAVQVYGSGFGRSPIPLTWVGTPLVTGNSVENKLVYPASCAIDVGCTPASNQLLVGSMRVMIFADFAVGDVNIGSSTAVKVLDDLVPSKVGQLRFVYTPATGQPDRQVGVPMTAESDATVKWGGAFSQSQMGASGVTHKSSFAVMNLSDSPQSVLVSVYDQNNRFVLSQTTEVLQPKGTTGKVLEDWLGNFIPQPMLSQDGLFYGKLVFEGAGKGKIVPLLLEFVGNSVASRLTYQIQ